MRIPMPTRTVDIPNVNNRLGVHIRHQCKPGYPQIFKAGCMRAAMLLDLEHGHYITAQQHIADTGDHTHADSRGRGYLRAMQGLSLIHI